VASVTAPLIFNLLSEVGDVDDIGWNGTQRSLLWRYNQHYFDDLTSRKSSVCSELHNKLIANWKENNPPAQGVGWEPYPLSMRIVNWIKFSLNGGVLSQSDLDNLGVQVDWLSKRLEWHLLGNHLLANAKALYFAGCFFDNPVANGWLQRGRDIVSAQLGEQFLGDGGHFELSPMYHAIVLEDVLDLINIARAFGREEDADDWGNLVPKLRAWLFYMCHPDGNVAFFNDSAFDVAGSYHELVAYSGRLGLTSELRHHRSIHLADSGYVRLVSRDVVVICDVANVGPDYLPGHAHADSLSFEVSVGDERLFVNSGISEYGIGPERHRQRSTRAHNTMVIDDENSSEVWGGFRVGRRARPCDLEVSLEASPMRVSCAHDGYSRFNSNKVHRRTWVMHEDRLTIEDRVEGQANSCEVNFYCHPDVRVEQAGSEVRLTLKSRRTLTMAVSQGSIAVEDSSWHPRFGATADNKVIRVRVPNYFCLTEIQF